MAQTASTGNLADAQRRIIAAVRYTNEHNAPAMALTEQFSLARGAKQIDVPKVGQMTVSDLVDGQDIVDEEEIGMTSVTLTSAEVGAKVILTDKLIRQSVPNIYTMVGKQLGEAMARKEDTDVHALYTNLNDGTNLGLAGASFHLDNIAAAITYAKANKFGTNLYIIQHPNSVYDVVRSGALGPQSNTNFPEGFQKDLLGNFFTGLRPLNGVPIFEDGNLSIDSSNDATGVIADKGAIATLRSLNTRTERQRDASLRATELVMVSDYGVFELDDTKGAGWTVDAAAPVTTSTA